MSIQKTTLANYHLAFTYKQTKHIVCIGWYLSEQGKFFKLREGLGKKKCSFAKKGIINWKQDVC
jgi:hypothetical protein